jgi:23S rRNA (uracil1939-C5)-methyltransferase
MTEMDITIEKLIYGGEGLAHHNGATVFVPFVLPAERVEVEPVEQKKKFVRARVEKLLQPSVDRATPRCPHFGVCGGCDYQHIPYEAQLNYKVEILRETLGRLGRIEWPGAISAHASPPWAYRNRAQWKVRPFSEDKSDAKLSIGYFRANSTALIQVEECSIISPLLSKTFFELRDLLASGALPRSLREIEAFVDAADSKILLTATFSGFSSKAADLAEKIRAAVPGIESLLFHDPTRDRMELFGPGFLEYETGGLKYRVGHFSFFQVNRFLIEELVRQVVEPEKPGRLALDLFAGVGLFSIPLGEKFDRVAAAESNPAAVRDFETNMRGKGAIEVRAADAGRFLGKIREKPDLVVLDPPRAGLTPEAIARLVKMRPERITYVSCEPPTLARDLAALRNGGYEISDLHLFDLFPQTFHVETVARLSRRK